MKTMKIICLSILAILEGFGAAFLFYQSISQSSLGLALSLGLASAMCGIACVICGCGIAIVIVKDRWFKNDK